MKALVAHVYYRERGGEDAVFENEVALLSDGGIDVVPLPFTNEALNDGRLIDRVKIGAGAAWSRQGYCAVDEAIRTHRPDLVHFHNTFPLLSPSVYAACKAQGVPVVQTLHNYRLLCAAGTLFRSGRVCEVCVGRVPLPALRYRCYRGNWPATAAVVAMQFMQRALDKYGASVTKYIALSEFARAILTRGGVPSDRITVKPNFLAKKCQPNLRVGGYALFVGRLTADKGVRVLLDAWRYVENLPLVLAGEGPLLGEVQRVCDERSANVRALGYLDAKTASDWIAGSAFLVVPSLWYEGFPMVVLEAFGHGKPVVCSQLGGLDELVEEDVTGRKFSTGDPRALARVVQKLASERPAILRMGEMASALVEEKYSPRVNFQQLRSVYEAALESHC